MISLAYQTEFTNCKRIFSVFGNVDGTARITVRDTATMDVVKEVYDIDTEDALELYEKLLEMYTKCENCMSQCCTH